MRTLVTWAAGLGSDVRYAVRLLLRAPVFTVSAIAVLALGIGASTAVFSLVNAVLLKPLPYADAERQMVLWEHNVTRDRPRNVINAANFFAWKARNRTFADMAIYSQQRANLTGSGEAEELQGMAVSANLLAMIGARPLTGRLFAAGEDADGAAATVIISQGLWQRRFGGRADVLGHAIALGGRPTTIVGVLPTTFELLGQRAEIWLPLVISPPQRQFRGRSFTGLGVLAPGVTRDQAQADMAGIARQLTIEQPDFDSGWTVNVVPLREQLAGGLRPVLAALLAAVVAVLLIACVNLMNLLLARSAARQREMAVRAALGAGTGRLLRQLLVEVGVLVAVGGAVGLLLARWLQTLMVAAAQTQAPIPLLGEATFDTAVVGFALAATVLAAVLCGLAPVWTLRRTSILVSLRDGGRGTTDAGHGRLRAALVVAEVTLAVVLLAGASLLGRSVVSLQAVQPGFDSARVLTMRVTMSGVTLADAPRVARFHDEVVARLAQVPGVRSAAGTVFLPMTGPGSATSFWMLDRPEPSPADRPTADIRPVTAGYFATLGVPVLAGRDFDSRDTTSRPFVAVVNESFVKRHSPDANPLGRRFVYSWDVPTAVEIVGVVGDVKLTSLDGEVRGTVYLPNQQRTSQMMTYVMRTDGEPSGVAPSATAALRAMAPDQPVAQVRPLREVVEQSTARPRVTAMALGVFALVAVLLAAIGVYGVIAYGVSLRCPEFGVRLALGASPASIGRLVMRQGLSLVAIGLGLGVVLALPMAWALRAQLFGIEPFDVPTMAMVALMIGVVGVAACWFPALRAARMDPVAALRAS